MQEILQQENGVLAFSGLPARSPAGNRILSSRHLRTVRFHYSGRLFIIKVEMKRALMRTSPLIAVMALLFLPALNTPAEVHPRSAATGQTETSDADRIMRAFTTKEAEFGRALNSYSFKRDALIQSIGMGGQVIGEYHRVSNFTFDDQGNRYEKISFFPMPTMGE